MAPCGAASRCLLCLDAMREVVFCLVLKFNVALRWSLKFWVDVGCNRLLISFNFAASRLVYVCQQIQLQHDPISLCITQSLNPVLFPKYRKLSSPHANFNTPFG